MILLFVTMVIGRVDSLILGYGLFRVASDVEKLPFPMAPIAAMGVLAITENASGKEGWRWRCFSLASAIGMALVWCTSPYQPYPEHFIGTIPDSAHPVVRHDHEYAGIITCGGNRYLL